MWNLGSDTLRHAVLVYYPDTISKADTVQWSGQILAGLKQEVVLNSVFLENGGHSIHASVSRPNNRPIINSTLAGCQSVVTVAQKPVAPPIHEYFTAAGFPYPGWSVYNPSKDGNTWKRVSYPIDTTTIMLQALQLRLFTMTEGTYNDVFLPLLDVSKMNSLKLGIDAAWCSNGDPDMSHDTLSVDVTTDCGINWKNVLKKWGADLSFSGCGQFEFIGWLPDTSRWKKFLVDLSGESGSGNLLIRVRGVKSFSGNNLYIRNIFLGPDLGVDQTVPDPVVSVCPNPATDVLKINLPAELNGPVRITVYDRVGVKVYSGQIIEIPADKPAYTLNISGFIDGIYLLQLESGSRRICTKFIKFTLQTCTFTHRRIKIQSASQALSVLEAHS